MLAHGADTFAEEIAAVGSRHEPSRPDPADDVTPAAEWPDTSSCDAVVIGSGAGGAFAARALARAGLRHRDRRGGRALDRRADPQLAPARPLRRHLPRRRHDDGLRQPGDRAAAGPGGRRHDRDQLGHLLPAPDRGRDRLAPSSMGSPWPISSCSARESPTSKRRSASPRHRWRCWAATENSRSRERRRSDWQSAPLRRNAPGCRGACQCAIGCPNNAKGGVHLNALPQACEAGARIVTGLSVKRVLTERGRATGVEAPRADGRVRISAPKVIVAAGAIGTPPLLRRSGLGDHPQMGRSLSIHPAPGSPPPSRTRSCPGAA